MKFNENIKKLLERESINASTLARNINVAERNLYRLISDKNSNPTLSSLRPIAKFFNVSVSQLIGEDVLNFDNASYSRRTISNIPLIELSELTAIIESHEESNARETISTDATVSDKSFAFRINHGGLEPCFPKGSIVVIDTNRNYSHGNFVLIISDNEKMPQMREIISDGSDICLKSANPALSQIKMSRLSTNDKVLGVVAQINSYY